MCFGGMGEMISICIWSVCLVFVTLVVVCESLKGAVEIWQVLEFQGSVLFLVAAILRYK